MAPFYKTDALLGLPNASTPSKFFKVEEISSSSDEENAYETKHQDAEDFVVLFINETSLGISPVLEIKINNKIVISAIVDSGSEVNLISQEVYERLTQAGNIIPVLPVQGVVLVTAFGKKSNRIRLQALLEFTVGDDEFEGVFMVSPQLSNDAILGCQFLREFGIIIDFKHESIKYVRGDVGREHVFAMIGTLQKVSKNVSGEVVLSNPMSAVQRTQVLSAGCNDLHKPRAVDSCLILKPPQPNAAGTENCEGLSDGSSPKNF